MVIEEKKKGKEQKKKKGFYFFFPLSSLFFPIKEKPNRVGKNIKGTI